MSDLSRGARRPVRPGPAGPGQERRGTAPRSPSPRDRSAPPVTSTFGVSLQRLVASCRQHALRAPQAHARRPAGSRRACCRRTVRRSQSPCLARCAMSLVFVSRLADHQVRAGNDDAAEMPSVGVEAIDRHGSADAHHAHRAMLERVRADHGQPAIHAELCRLRIGIANSAGQRRRSHELALRFATSAQPPRARPRPCAVR